MVIRSIKLRDFRNYSQLEVEFGEKINFLYGNNGQGKTNLIEAIFYLTHLRSFRTAIPKSLFYVDSDSASIEAVLSKRSVKHQIVIDLQKGFKRVLVDQKSVGLSSEYMKNFFSLLFAPDLLQAFKEYPGERRNFIDRVLIVIDPGYSQLMKDFNRIKKQKNFILKSGALKELPVWNQLLAELIPKMVQSRRVLVDAINCKIDHIFCELTGRTEQLQFQYQDDFSHRLESINSSTVALFLQQKAVSEQTRGFMCYGPHKDDFWMTMDEKRDKVFFSQGEYRISFLSLQLAINQIVADRLRFNPVILLDDIFSELDERVCGKTLEFVLNHQNQVFISSTSVPTAYMQIGAMHHIAAGKRISE